MKKFLPSMLAYSIFAAAAVWTAAFFLLPMESVSAGSEIAYKSANAFSFLFETLPSILLTGFLLACSLAFADSEEKAKGRFSPEISKLLKKIIAAALATTFVASLAVLIFLPFEKSKKKFMHEIPGLMTDYMRLAEQYRLQKNPEAATQYLKKALALAPNNNELKERDRLIEAELKEMKSKLREERNKSFVETNLNDNGKKFNGFDESEMTVLQMLQKAGELFAAKDFFGAHYLSVQAERLCGPNDPNIAEAKSMASAAWNKLQAAQKEEPTEGNLFFRKKLEGYKA
ncbi:MAG: tetratricopeptide repeat protein, partial [Treponema sp.]|nr:tetratricopeptide repeat protein [Treponema sp.]